MAVDAGVAVDRAQQVQIAHDRRRAQVEDLGDGGLDPLDRDRMGSEGLTLCKSYTPLVLFVLTVE